MHRWPAYLNSIIKTVGTTIKKQWFCLFVQNTWTLPSLVQQRHSVSPTAPQALRCSSPASIDRSRAHRSVDWCRPIDAAQSRVAVQPGSAHRGRCDTRAPDVCHYRRRRWRRSAGVRSPLKMRKAQWQWRQRWTGNDIRRRFGELWSTAVANTLHDTCVLTLSFDINKTVIISVRNSRWRFSISYFSEPALHCHC